MKIVMGGNDPIIPTVEAIESMQRNVDYWGRRCEQAEAEINRLRAERDDAREQRRRWQEASAADRAENQRLRAEIKAMREQDWDALISARLAAQKAARGE